MQLNTRKPLLYVEDHNQITVYSKNVPGPIYSQVQTADLRTDLSQNPQRIEFTQKNFPYLCVTTSQQMGRGLRVPF